MKKYQDTEIEKARKLRLEFKYSFTQIQKLTGIPATTIRNWCKNDSLGTRWDTLIITNAREREKIKQSEKEAVNSFVKIDSNAAKVFASILYWCEGAKYPSSNKVDLANSDPTLLKIFIKFLRLGFLLDESKLRIKLQIHDTQDFEQIKKYWSNILNIPTSQFMKPTITKKGGGKHRKEYFGTCTIRYLDYKLQLKLIGIYEAFAQKLI